MGRDQEEVDFEVLPRETWSKVEESVSRYDYSRGVAGDQVQAGVAGWMREIWFIGIASRILSMHCILYIIDSLSHSLTRVVARVFLREQDAMPMLQLIIERYILHLRKKLSNPLLWRWLVAWLKVEELVVASA